MSLRTKIGALGATAAAIAVALGVLGSSAVNATANVVIVSPTAAAIGIAVTVTASYTDDSPIAQTSAVLTSTNPAIGVFSAAPTFTLNADTQVTTGVGTATLAISSDGDTIIETTTFTVPFTCTADGVTNMALTEGGVTVASVNVICGSGAGGIIVPTSAVRGIAIGGSSSNITNRTSVEIVPAPGSDNDARIDVRVLSGPSEVNGAHVTFLVDNGLITIGDGTATLPPATPDADTNHGVAEPVIETAIAAAAGLTSSGDNCDRGTANPAGSASVIPWTALPTIVGVTGTEPVPVSVARPSSISPRASDGLTGGTEPSTVGASTGGGATASAGFISACYLASDIDFDQSLWARPGRATITIIISVPTSTSLVVTETITVVGPPASITVAASPSSLRCGEKATITATVKDSIGQNVSDHSRVELITNLGGVLAGTGAVISQASFTAPVSNTIAETFGGVATAFLLTSESHSGPYEVVVTAGGHSPGLGVGGLFSTSPISAQVTVTCAIPAAVAAPAPAPTVRAPSTGTGPITAPNTGDAGLAGSSGSSWVLFVIAGAAAFALAGVASLRFARR